MNFKSPGEDSSHGWTPCALRHRVGGIQDLCTCFLFAGFLGWLIEATVVADPARQARLSVWTNSAASLESIREPAEWPARRDLILNSMRSIQGEPPPLAHTQMERSAIQWKLEACECLPGYWRAEIQYYTRSGSDWIPAHLLVPASVDVDTDTDTDTDPRGRCRERLMGILTGAVSPALRFPGVLALHQTHPAGSRLVVGLVPGRPDDLYGVELVKRGYVVLAPNYPLLGDYQPELRQDGHVSGTMKAIWDNVAGLDLLELLPVVDDRRGFGTIGHSLGGHNGLFTAVYDSRLTVVVSSCGFDSFRDYYGGDPALWGPERGWCQTRYMPRLTVYQGRLQDLPFDFAEVLAAIAPRRVFVNAPIRDDNFRWQSAALETLEARWVYALLGVSEHLEIWHPDHGHQFAESQRQRAYAFMDQALKGD